MVYQSVSAILVKDVVIAVATRFPAPAYRALSQHAARALRDAILAGHYRPGERLVERTLADDLAISRAPVRDALRLLAKDGLVSLVPHRGAIVTAVSPELVVDTFAVRTLLEGLAARLATTRMSEEDLARLEALVGEMSVAGPDPDAGLLVDQDLEFHRVLAGACGRPVLLEALGAIWNKTYLLISASRAAYPLDRIAALHAPILEAARRRDPDGVEGAIREHLAFGERTLLAHLRATPSP